MLLLFGIVGAYFVVDRLDLVTPSSCTSRSFRELDVGNRCRITGEVFPLAEGQREIGTLRRASLIGEGTSYNQFNLRDEAGPVAIHFVSAEMLLPPTGRRVQVDVEVSEVIAGAKVLVAQDWDYVE